MKRGEKMNISNRIIQLAQENNGIITTAQITANGIYRGNLKKLVDSGKLEKTERGVYILPEIWEDEFVNLQGRFKKGIFSNETALFLWDLTDRTPNKFNMTFPKNYNLTNAKNEGVICTASKKEWYEEGKVMVKSPSGHTVNAYCMERTLCDIIRNRQGVDLGVIKEAYKQYVSRKDKNLPLLSIYAKQFKIEDKVRRYVEVLI